MRRHPLVGLSIIKVVAKFFGFVVRHFGVRTRNKVATCCEKPTKCFSQRRIQTEPLGKNVSCTAENCRRIRKAFIGIDEFSCRLKRHKRAIRKQLVCQRFEPGFSSNHCAGTALGLEGSVNVFERLLGIGAGNVFT